MGLPPILKLRSDNSESTISRPATKRNVDFDEDNSLTIELKFNKRRSSQETKLRPLNFFSKMNPTKAKKASAFVDFITSKSKKSMSPSKFKLEALNN